MTDPKALEAMVEEAAIHLCFSGFSQETQASYKSPKSYWRLVVPAQKDRYRQEVRAALSALRAAGYAVVPASFLDEPSHDEYRQTLAMVTKLLEAGGPIPAREIPLTFMVCFMDVRRAMLSSASPSPVESSGDSAAQAGGVGEG